MTEHHLSPITRTAIVASVLAAVMWRSEAQEPADQLPNVRWDDRHLEVDLNGDGWTDIVQIGDTWIGEPSRIEQSEDGVWTLIPSTEQWVPEASGVWALNGYPPGGGVVGLLQAGSYTDLRILNRRLQARHDGLPQRWDTVYMLRGQLPPFRIAFGEPNGSDPVYRGQFVWTTTESLSALLLACEGLPCERDIVPEVRVRTAETNLLVYERRVSLGDGRLDVVGHTWTFTPTLWSPSWHGYGLSWDVCIADGCASSPGPGIESGAWFGMYVP